MDFNKLIKKDNLHHAYLLIGGDFEMQKTLVSFVGDSLNLKISGNPDFQVLEYDTLTIDIARNISESSGRKDFSGEKKVFVLNVNTITEEAQNSLLKIFEEPTSGTHFFITMPQDILLPTLRSRMQILKFESLEGHKLESVLSKPLAKRLELVKEITDGISDEEKTKQDAIGFLNQIEKELYESGLERTKEKLKVCQLTRSSLYNRGAPIKMILENLVLSI